jgi:CubicO group peptidase (beta-lactamase class C family)
MVIHSHAKNPPQKNRLNNQINFLGNVVYSKSVGKGSLKEGATFDMSEDTVCIIASMTKLMTSVAVLQCVEDGKLDLDQDVKSLLPDIGKYGIMTGFDEKTKSAILTPSDKTITLRMLLSHTSGHEYDWLSPSITQWRATRGETPWAGLTVEEKSTVPLLFAPGTGFAYGAGHDWAGKAIERATGSTLEEYMSARIWVPLGIENDFSFYPESKSYMKDRLGAVSMVNDKGDQPIVDAPEFDARFGATDCLGGGPCWATPRAYYTFLSAILQRDPKLLTLSSYEELFKPQLDEQCEKAMNEYIALSPVHTQFLGLRVAPQAPVTWTFAGLMPKDKLDGRCSSGTVMWAGATSSQWFIDTKAGVCGTAVCQVLPPMHPPVMELHDRFQRAIFQRFGRN